MIAPKPPRTTELMNSLEELTDDLAGATSINPPHDADADDDDNGNAVTASYNNRSSTSSSPTATASAGWPIMIKLRKS